MDRFCLDRFQVIYSFQIHFPKKLPPGVICVIQKFQFVLLLEQVQNNNGPAVPKLGPFTPMTLM